MYGDSLKSTLVGVVVPEETVVFEWAKENGVKADMKTLAESNALKETILKDMVDQGKIGGLKGFEQVIQNFAGKASQFILKNVCCLL